MMVVQSLSFLEDGSVAVTYMDSTTDVRNRELLVMHHQLLIRPGTQGKDYLDEIEDVRDAVKRLLDDALEDWQTTTDVGTKGDSNGQD